VVLREQLEALTAAVAALGERIDRQEASASSPST
jgi:hypothetical protein